MVATVAQVVVGDKIGCCEEGNKCRLDRFLSKQVRAC